MLVLLRFEGESVAFLDENDNEIARVVLVQSKRGKARLGFEANRRIKIFRGEIADRIERQRNKGAA